MKGSSTSFFICFFALCLLWGCAQNADTGIKNSQFITTENSAETSEMRADIILPAPVSGYLGVEKGTEIPLAQANSVTAEFFSENLSVWSKGILCDVSDHVSYFKSVFGGDFETVALFLGMSGAFSCGQAVGYTLDTSFLRLFISGIDIIPKELYVLFLSDKEMLVFDGVGRSLLFEKTSGKKEIDLFDLDISATFRGCDTAEVVSIILSAFNATVDLPEIRVDGDVKVRLFTEGKEGRPVGFTADFYTEGGRIVCSMKDAFLSFFYFDRKGNDKFSYCGKVYRSLGGNGVTGGGVIGSGGRGGLLQNLLRLVNVDSLSLRTDDICYPSGERLSVMGELFFVNAGGGGSENKLTFSLSDGTVCGSLCDISDGAEVVSAVLSDGGVAIDYAGRKLSFPLSSPSDGEQTDAVRTSAYGGVNVNDFFGYIEKISLSKNGCSVRLDESKLNALLAEYYSRFSDSGECRDLYDDVVLPKIKNALPKFVNALLDMGFFASHKARLKRNVSRLSPSVRVATVVLD